MTTDSSPTDDSLPPPIGAEGAGLFETASDREANARAIAAAAPTPAPDTRPDQAQVRVLPEALRPALYTLLGQVADAKYVLGRRYAEWCTGAPQLESAVAAAAMAQDELGHARSFYPLLRGFLEDSVEHRSAMEERGWQQRPTPTLRVLSARFNTWEELIAANLVVDAALTVFFEAAQDSAYEPLRQRARKIVSEEGAHAAHAQGWLRRLAVDPAHRATLDAAVQRMGAEALAWYGPADDPILAPLQQASILVRGPDDLRAALRGRLDPLLTGAGLHPLPTTLNWAAWDSATRAFRG